MSRRRPALAPLSGLAAAALGLGLIAAVAPPAAAVECTAVSISADTPALPDDVAAGEVYCLDVSALVGEGTVTSAADLAWSSDGEGELDIMSGYDAGTQTLLWTVKGRPHKWSSSITLGIDGTPTSIAYDWAAPTINGAPAAEFFRNDGDMTQTYPDSRPGHDGGWWNDLLVVAEKLPATMDLGESFTGDMTVECSNPQYDADTGRSTQVLYMQKYFEWDHYAWPVYQATPVDWGDASITVDDGTETGMSGSWAQTGDHWTWTGTYTFTASSVGFATIVMGGYNSPCSWSGVWDYMFWVDVIDPHGVVDNAVTGPSQQVSIDVLANDPEGSELDTISVQPGHGTAEIVDGEIVYVPEDGFLGTDTFSYTLVGVDGDVVVTVDVEQAPPGSPGDLEVSDITSTTAHVTWTPPADDGAGIAEYVVRVSLAGEDDWTSAAATDGLEADVSGLEPSTDYDLEVVAVADDEQQSDPAAAEFTTAAGSAPDAPSRSVATGGTAAVTVNGLAEGSVLTAGDPEPGVAGIEIDGAQVRITTVRGFTGIINQPVLVDGDQTVIVTVVVNPAAPATRHFAVAQHGASVVTWAWARGATAYVVTVNGAEVCRTGPAGRRCTVQRILGPAAVVKVRALGHSATASAAVRASYRRPASAQVVATVGFGTSGVSLDAADKRQVRALAQRIARNGFRAVVVDGYAAAALVGPAAEASQLRASRLRAQAVGTYLVARLRALGSSAVVTVRWHGADHPVASNLAFNGRMENRRADISVR